MLHMHGELAVLKCEICGTKTRDLEHTDEASFLPCENCGHPRLRPDVVWFGEMPYHMAEIEQALATCTHFLAIGTSGAVYPAAGFLDVARSRSVFTYVLALERPDNCHPDDIYVEGRAKDTVQRVVSELLG